MNDIIKENDNSINIIKEYQKKIESLENNYKEMKENFSKQKTEFEEEKKLIIKILSKKYNEVLDKYICDYNKKIDIYLNKIQKLNNKLYK